MLRAGIVGLPNIGKTTLFNAVTAQSSGLIANYAFSTSKPNVGVVAVILTAFLIPFLDQAAGLGRSNRLFTVLGLIAIAYMIVAVSLAYLT